MSFKTLIWEFVLGSVVGFVLVFFLKIRVCACLLFITHDDSVDKTNIQLEHIQRLLNVLQVAVSDTINLNQPGLWFVFLKVFLKSFLSWTWISYCISYRWLISNYEIEKMQWQLLQTYHAWIAEDVHLQGQKNAQKVCRHAEKQKAYREKDHNMSRKTGFPLNCFLLSDLSCMFPSIIPIKDGQNLFSHAHFSDILTSTHH